MASKHDKTSSHTALTLRVAGKNKCDNAAPASAQSRSGPSTLPFVSSPKVSKFTSGTKEVVNRGKAEWYRNRPWLALSRNSSPVPLKIRRKAAMHVKSVES
ncbi:hypothetical protein TNCV_3011011 [Trichonephila clavipes]|nr:hypothetical protein TNCV_3011011 [Trichonephila clavipes]